MATEQVRDGNGETHSPGGLWVSPIPGLRAELLAPGASHYGGGQSGVGAEDHVTAAARWLWRTKLRSRLMAVADRSGR